VHSKVPFLKRDDQLAARIDRRVLEDHQVEVDNLPGPDGLPYAENGARSCPICCLERER
jgi:hypothetical protein